MRLFPQNRLAEFLQYHETGDCGCNAVVLKKYAEIKGLTKQQAWELCYLFAITYSVPSAVVLFENRHKDLLKFQRRIIFQSDRRWVNYQDRFAKAIAFYREMPSFEEFVTNNTKGNKLSLDSAYHDICKNWYYFKRFAAYLFLETLTGVLSLSVEHDLLMDWEHGDTATSGLLNLMGLDTQAAAFDDFSILSIESSTLNRAVREVQREVLKRGQGNPEIISIETTLCAYRKHFKGTRYNGYYLDRMLEELHRMEPKFPSVVATIFGIRRQCFHSQVLGECSGWTGIRKEMKKYYLKNGEIHYDYKKAAN